MSFWIDVHTHLEMLEHSPEDTIASARAVGVERMITIGTRPDENKKILAIARKFFPTVSCTLGIHPHEARFYNEAVGTEIRSNLKEPCVVGIGEIGLDYYYEHSPREIQREAFEKQLSLAVSSGMPIEIHTRDAEQDTVSILKNFQGRVKGLFHCFTGTQWLAEEGLSMDFDISISGVATFKNADALREVVKMVPLERLHVETDAPFLSPAPMRGKKNTPAFMIHTAKLVADLKGVTEEQLSRQLLLNAQRLFPRLNIQG